MARQQKKKNVIVKKNFVLQKIDYRWPALMAIIAFALYANTLHHGYVLDDSVAIVRNQFVQKGFDGIGDILKVDLWHFSNLTLGYYRPLSLITFAVEHELFGNNPHISHLINVLLYALTGFMLSLLLMELFSGSRKIFPFLICVLFIAHPIHTEVVANLKSRDELLSFLGVISVLFLMLRQEGKRSKIYLISSILIYYLAMLSKETAITGAVLLPASFYFFRQKSIYESIKKTIPFILVVLIFYIQKNIILGTIPAGVFNELNNYPYAHSKFSSSMVLFVYMIRLLFFPHPLMYDYSYNQIPSASWSDPFTIIGFLLFAGLLFLTLRGFLKKKVWGFALVFFFATLLPALAFVWLRGGIMAERFLYSASLGFCIAFVYFLAKFFKMDFRDANSKPSPVVSAKPGQATETVSTFSTKKLISIVALVGLVSIAYSFKTIDRNKAWKDNMTLFSNDVVHATNSTQNNRHYGNELLNLAIAEKDSAKRFESAYKSFYYLNKAITINPRFGEALGDLGRFYNEIKFIPDSAIYYYKMCIRSTPGAAITYSNLGLVYLDIQKYELASYYFNRAIEINPTFQDAKQHAADLKAASGLDVHIYPGGEDPKYDSPEFGLPMKISN